MDKKTIGMRQKIQMKF